jgi:DNA-binding transcriptional ArsR family regulator
MSTALQNPERVKELAEVLKAVAHPTRLQIVGMLCLKPCTVTDLCTELQTPQSLVSQHLRVLRMQQLVQVVRRGGNATYSLKENRLRDLVTCLNGCGDRGQG